MIPCAKVAGNSISHHAEAFYVQTSLSNISFVLFLDRVPVSMLCEDKLCGEFSIFNSITEVKTSPFIFPMSSNICLGGAFNAEVSSVDRTVASNIRPFRLHFHTDSVEAPNDIDNRGFCLDYIQQPCTNG
jgi:hypothetical protein